MTEHKFTSGQVETLATLILYTDSMEEIMDDFTIEQLHSVAASAVAQAK